MRADHNGNSQCLERTAAVKKMSFFQFSSDCMGVKKIENYLTKVFYFGYNTSIEILARIMVQREINFGLALIFLPGFQKN